MTEISQEQDLLRYLLLNWRSTLLGLLASGSGDEQQVPRAINRCSLIMDMLDKSRAASEGPRAQQSSIADQLALLVTEIEHLAEAKELSTG